MERKVRFRNLLCYGVGDLYGGGSFFIVGTMSMFYLVAVAGLSPLWAALVPGLGKIWDSFSDPLMGYLTDRTRSRFGRRRVFFLAAVIPVALTFTLIWLPVRSWFPSLFSGDFPVFLYYFLAYLCFYTVTTMAMVPYSALSAEMTRDFRERNRLTSTRMFFSILAALIAGGLAQPLVHSFRDPSTGYLVMGLCFGVLFALPWIFVFFGTWELPLEEGEAADRKGIFRNFGSIFRNRSFRVHIMMYIASYAAMDILMGWFLFYLTDVLGRPGLFAVLLPVLVISEMACVPLYAWISNRQGHARAFIIGMSVMALGMVLMAFHPPQSPAVLLVLNSALIGCGLSAGVIIPYTILPFVIDVDQLITGKKRAGTYAGAMTLLRKLIQGALVMPLLGFMLFLIGYQTPTETETLVLTAAGRFADSAEAFAQSSSPAELEAMDIFAGTIRSAAGAIEDPVRRSAAQGASEEAQLITGLIRQNPQEGSRRADELFRMLSDALAVRQSERTVSLLKLLFTLLPLVCIILGILAALRFRITPETHRIITDEITRLSSGGTKDEADEHIRRTCEMLTGWAYEDLHQK